MEDSGSDMENVMAASSEILFGVVGTGVVVVVVVVVVVGGGVGGCVVVVRGGDDVTSEAVTLRSVNWEPAPGPAFWRVASRPGFADSSDVRAVTLPPTDAIRCGGTTSTTGEAGREDERSGVEGSGGERSGVEGSGGEGLSSVKSFTFSIRAASAFCWAKRAIAKNIRRKVAL